MTVQIAAAAEPSPSQRIAAEIRAEMGRQQISARELGRLLGRSHMWTSRRIGSTADVAITVDEIQQIADVLEVASGRFLVDAGWPSYDNDPNPSGPGRRAVRHQGLEPRTRWLRVIDDLADAA